LHAIFLGCGEDGGRIGSSGIGAMIKKKGKSRGKGKGKGEGKTSAATKKTATKTKTKSRKRSRKELNPAEVRKDIAKIVGSGAKEMTVAVMNEAMKGQLAPAKYLFEVAGVYPPANDGMQATQEEDCLAKTLLDRLDPSRKAENEPQNAAGKLPDVTHNEAQADAGKSGSEAASDDAASGDVVTA
jgi:hypothetical protein